MVELPDFDILERLISSIREKSLRLAELDHAVKSMQANVYKLVTTMPEYFIGGKPPAISYVDNVYAYPGLGGELLPHREELGRLKAEIEILKSLLDLQKTKIDIWRTQQANQRMAVL